MRVEITKNRTTGKAKGFADKCWEDAGFCACPARHALPPLPMQYKVQVPTGGKGGLLSRKPLQQSLGGRENLSRHDERLDGETYPHPVWRGRPREEATAAAAASSRPPFPCARSNSREQTKTTDFLLSRQGKWLDRLKRSFLETKTRHRFWDPASLCSNEILWGVVLACMVSTDIPDVCSRPTCTKFEVLNTKTP
jgi:hypothetical protein